MPISNHHCNNSNYHSTYKLTVSDFNSSSSPVYSLEMNVWAIARKIEAKMETCLKCKSFQ